MRAFRGILKDGTRVKAAVKVLSTFEGLKRVAGRAAVLQDLLAKPHLFAISSDSGIRAHAASAASRTRSMTAGRDRPTSSAMAW